MKFPSNTSAFTTLRRRLFRPPIAAVLIWFVAIWWGERGVFERSVKDCQWYRWETWPAQARPHHVLLVADPQLVDPHTYPGRPWPLSTLTILYTDLYLRRSYRYLQEVVRPDATIFLGDLFDGGREWATASSSSPEQRYKKYGSKFWLKEYMRFSDIFLRSWYKGPVASRGEPWGRKVLAAVAGNHDLGFANGIQPAVKSRFDAYFGPLNRVDIIGNHSIVTLDTVSLSAMDQFDPETGSSGAGDGTASATPSSKIWKPVEDFLTSANAIRDQAVNHAFQYLSQGHGEDHAIPGPQFVPDLMSLAEQSTTHQDTARLRPHVPSSLFPTIVLSHVPLYRSDQISCGPYREHGTAIPISAGYQYQNVLTPLISQDIIKHLIPEEVVMIYSGDDHDYCEMEHSEFTGRIREITVKSMSWAMGIRKPGVQLVSLWNPIDIEKIKTGTGSDFGGPKETIQNHLCLLPDQLSIFIRYGQLLGLTLIVLATAAVRSNQTLDASQSATEKSGPVLPLFQRQHIDSASASHSSSSSSSPSSTGQLYININNNNNHTLSTRKSALGTYGNLPASSRSTSPSKAATTEERNDPFQPSSQAHIFDLDPDATDAWGMPRKFSSSGSRNPAGKHSQRRRKGSRLSLFAQSVWQVAWPVLLWYGWLIWTG